MTIFNDQQSLSFLVNQSAHIETEVYKTKYPEFQYDKLIPIDTSAGEWASTVTFFSSDGAGKANWFQGDASNTNRADTSYTQHNESVYMAEIGYGYNIAELGEAMRLGVNLTSDKAMYANRAYHQFIENVSLNGDSDKGLEGLINHSSVTAVDAPATGTGSSPDWSDKTVTQILKDFNTLLTGQYISSLTVEMASTVALPVETMALLTENLVPNTSVTLLDHIRTANIYTQTTGQPLTIRAIRGLETGTADGNGRAIAYRNDKDVLKLHLPMPHRFLAPQQSNLQFNVPGVFRMSGLEVRRPGAIRYMDDIIDNS